METSPKAVKEEQHDITEAITEVLRLAAISETVETNNAIPQVASSSEEAPPSNISTKESNIQKIQQNKRLRHEWSHTKKLFELAAHSLCQSEDCKCTGWKPPNSGQTLSRSDESLIPNCTDPCRHCSHTLEAHVSHLTSITKDEINKLMDTLVDLENIFMSIHREDDEYTKRVYYYLFKLVRRCIAARTTPSVERFIEKPPFEKPSIAKAITNFVLYRFHGSDPVEYGTMCDVANTFLDCLNHWNLEAPSIRGQPISPLESKDYSVQYKRWLIFCHAPVFYDSLPYFETTLAFGRTLLRAVYDSLFKQLTHKCYTEQDGMTPEKRTLIITHFPPFLAMLKKEILSDTSPIWNTDFIPPTVAD